MQPETKDYTIADPALTVGTVHAGFVVQKVEPVRELSATAYVLRHQASGARTLWLACADQNRSFAIAFKTPPADDTGVFHILEHSVLCGSDRFPVKEPFVNLLKTSMQTFLNALTFPGKTMYPVASTNVADLENLMDVYLDAVLHPAIYHRPRIFEQEGWHLELQDADGDPAGTAANADDDPTGTAAGEKDGAPARLIYNGVVFNEMKGALSDPDEVLLEGVNRALFPQSPYRFESGGAPRAIPTLTYEKFLDTHARHYNLANSYTILYGDLDIDRELAFIGKRFDGACDRGAGAPNPLPLQPPVKAPLTQVRMATAPSNASVALAYVIGTAGQRERLLATDVLLDALAGSNEAPLKRAVLASGLGDDFIATLMGDSLQPQVIFQLKGAKPGVAAQFRQLVEQTCANLAADGIERERLEASLAQAEFNLREGDWGSYADGVALSMVAMQSWLYDDDDPLAYLRYEDALASLKAGLSQGAFERLLRQLVCDSAHCAEVELVPTGEGDASEEAAELAAKARELGPQGLAAVAEEVAALRAEQERPDAPEDLAKLPQLSVADITDAPAETPMTTDSAAPLPCWAHELDTHGIDYVWHYFDLRRLDAAELPYVGVLSDLLGKLDTHRHTASQLDTAVELNLGNLDFYVTTYGRDDAPAFAQPVFVVAASALSEKIGALATLPAEVWGQTVFTDTDRIRDILQQRRIGLEQYFLGSGHAAALAQLGTHLSSASDAAGRMGGVAYFLFLKDLLANWDRRKQALCEILGNLASRIFTSDEVVVSFAGPAEDRRRFWEQGGTLGLRQQGGLVAAHRLSLPAPDPASPAREAFVIPADVCYVAEGQPRSTADPDLPGTWQVAGRALSYDYLWNEVRVKGGAYGTGFRRTSDAVTAFWSFRDPGVDATVARFEGAADWLAHWDGSQEELEGYVVSTVAGHDTPLKPRLLARRQDTDRLGGHSPERRQQIRAQELATTADQLRSLAPTLASLPARRGVVVFGSAEKIAASGLDLAVTELFGGGEDAAAGTEDAADAEDAAGAEGGARG